MFKIISKYSLIPCGILPFKLFDNDQVAKDSETIQKALNQYKNVNETGKDRLYYMFTKDEFGNLSPELNSAFQVGFIGFFFGALYGGVTKSRVAYMNFIENNQATKFKNHFEAKRRLQDQVTMAFARGATKWGWKLGIFSMSYVMIATSVSVYRGKSSIVEYLVGGAVTGGLFRFTLGPRGMLVGSILGGVLGGVCGCLSLGLMKLTGLSMEEVRYWQYYFHTERNEKFQEAFKQHRRKDIDEIVKEQYNKPDSNKISLDPIDVNK